MTDSGQPRYDPDRQPTWGYCINASTFELTCPHCGGVCIVNRSEWLLGHIPRHYDRQEIFAKLRACPYCTRLARIPFKLRLNK